jgi:hypothetical protein
MAERAPRGPSHFRQRDLTVALKAIKASGITARIEIGKDGGFVIIPSHENAEPAVAEANPWDEVE